MLKRILLIRANKNAVNISRDYGGVSIIPFIVDFNQLWRYFPNDAEFDGPKLMEL